MKITDILNSFKDYLLNTELKKYIIKIYLFGSYAKGEATPDSDIDILIITSDGSLVERKLMNKVYDFLLDYKVPLEIITANVDDLFPIKDYFLYNVINYGKEVYSMEKEDIKKEAIRNIISLAEEYLESAEEVFSNGRFRLAIDAAYNSAELSAKSLILMRKDDIPGSHGSLVNIFGQLYVNTGEVEKEIGRIMNVSLKLRNDARYKPNAILDRENAQEVINLAKSLLKIAKEKIK